MYLCARGIDVNGRICARGIDVNGRVFVLGVSKRPVVHLC